METLKLALKTQTSMGSYFELLPETRRDMATYVERLALQLTRRALGQAEVKFIYTWMGLKDRGLGESLIAKRVAALPSSARSNSKFGNLMLLGMMEAPCDSKMH